MRIGLHRVREAHARWQHRAQCGELLRRYRAGVGKARRTVGLRQVAAGGVIKGEEGGHHAFQYGARRRTPSFSCSGVAAKLSLAWPRPPSPKARPGMSTTLASSRSLRAKARGSAWAEGGRGRKW